VVNIPDRFAPSAESALLAYGWPGNIRELENVVQQALLVAVGSEIQAEDLHLGGSLTGRGGAIAGLADLEGAFDDLFDGQGSDLHAEVEARLLRHALRRTGANQVHTAQLLGISRHVLRHRMKHYGLL
jgi:DNA-binding NtrC family response regulator